METMLIELTNEKARKLLLDMEDLDLIKVLKKTSGLSALRGQIQTKMSNTEIDQQLNALRNEWQQSI